jgi:hypothetical protein
MDEVPAGDPAAQRAAELVRRLEPYSEAPFARARIEARLESRAGSARRRFRLRTAWALAAALGCMSLGWAAIRQLRQPLAGAEDAEEQALPLVAPEVTAQPREDTEQEAPAPTVLPPPAAKPPRRTHPLAPPEAVVQEAAPPNPLLAETALLREAFQSLRRQRQPEAALLLLQKYYQQFPQGVLRSEADVAFVEALLALSREAQALEFLQGHPPASGPLRLLRGELLAAANRCPEAVVILEQCLQEPGLVERSLIGRARCRAQLGEAAGSRADLERYLKEFPDGKFAREAAAALGNR